MGVKDCTITNYDKHGFVPSAKRLQHDARAKPNWNLRDVHRARKGSSCRNLMGSLDKMPSMHLQLTLQNWFRALMANACRNRTWEVLSKTENQQRRMR